MWVEFFPPAFYYEKFQRTTELNMFTVNIPMPTIYILLLTFCSACSLMDLPMPLLLFSHSVTSNSLWPCGWSHTRLLCPSPSPGICSNSCPLRQWCHPTISFSVSLPSPPVLSLSQPASEPFPVSCLFAPGGQNIGASASASVLPMNIQGWFPVGLTVWTSLLLFKGLSRDFSNTTFKSIFLWCSAFFMVQHSHLYMTTGKTIALATWIFVGKVMFLLLKYI